MSKHVDPAGLEIRSEGENHDDVAVLTRGVDELRSASDELRTKLEKRLADLEVRLNRPGHVEQRQGNGDVEMRAFVEYARTGVIAPETRAALDTTTGAATVPDNFVAELLKNIVQFSPIRQYARTMTVSAANVILPKRTGTMSAAWVAEGGDSGETEPSYGQLELTPFEARCFSDISNQLLEDSALNLASELAYDAAEQFGVLESSAFVNGDGTGKPKGILADTTIGTIVSGNASTLGSAPADLLIDAFYTLKPAYRGNAVWLMNSKTLAAVRKLKDSNGQYLWQPSLQAGEPSTLLGRPAIETVDMPDVAANALPIAFGDLNAGYRIIDRVALTALRDPYSQASKSRTRFHWRRRVGGGVVKAEAIKLIKIAAA